MKISDALVRSYARRFTVEQLQKKVDDAQDKLDKGSTITQVSGHGTGYTRTITMTPEEAIELYTLAIEYKQGSTVNPVRTEAFYDPNTAC